MQTFTVFYAWQSDHPGNHCKHLIREAADQAASRITGDSNIPFKVVIDQDTQDVPGLCDIPATILAKIDKSDAFIADLTYVARSTPVDSSLSPRYCSNPNVLFELGYAFKVIGHERIILVMNDSHGPAEEQIFDLDHRRHPITYHYPNAELSRKDAINVLADDLEKAIRPMLRLGVRVAVSEPNEQLQAALDIAVQDLELLGCSEGTKYFTVGLRPTQHCHDRWSNLQALEEVISRRCVRLGGEPFPPHTKGNQRHQWGIANDMYCEPWLLTKTGIFLFKFPMEWSEGEYPQRGSSQGGHTLVARSWVNLETCRQNIFTTVLLFQRLSQEWDMQEDVEVSVTAPTKGLYLVTNGMRSLFLEHIEPCAADEFSFVRRLTVGDLQSSWRDLCVEIIDRFVELFPPVLGREIGTSRSWVDERVQHFNLSGAKS